MSSSQDLCIVCAYRATCQKKFSLQAGRHCPEFQRDLVLDRSEEEKKEVAEEAKEN